MKTTYRGRECSTLFWSCLSENTMFDVLLDKRDESHVDSQVEFCQQSDGLWARGDEQNLSRQYTKARCHNSCCNPYDRPYSYREWWCWCLWNRPEEIVYSSISWICRKAPLAGVCHHFSKSRGDSIFPRRFLVHETSDCFHKFHIFHGKGCPVLERQVAAAGWTMPNSWRELVGNRWNYSDLPNVPLGQRCQPGVLRQLWGKGALSSEWGRWLTVFHCKVREGHRRLRIVCTSSGFPSSARLQNEWDIERCSLQPVTSCERNGCFSLLPSIWLIVWLQRRVEEGRSCRETSQAAPLIADHRP